MRATLPKFTDRIELGSSKLAVSPFCVGVTAVPETVVAAYEAGINFFFVSCDLHWPSYAALRSGLELLCHLGKRDRIVVAAASYMTQASLFGTAFVDLLENLPVLERIDVLVAG